MQALKLSFARRVLAQARRQHKLSQASLFEKLRYMHRNPVKRGLVASPELWRWSSFRFYSLGEAGPVAVNRWEVLQMQIRSRAA